MKRRILALLTLVVLTVTTAVGCAPKAAEPAAAPAETPSAEQVKIAVIRNLPSDDHTKQFLDGCVTEGEALGYKVDTFISNGDDAKFQELVTQQIQKDYDGLVISHGKAEYSQAMLAPALEKGMKVVTFDTAFESGVPAGITSTSQDDYALATQSLDEIVARSASKPAKILKLWFGPGIPPLDRREEIYKKYEAEGKIKTVEVIGPSTLDDVQGEVSTRVGAILAKYPAGTIDAIWGSWDELAKGGYKAMQEANRKDIQLISIDISNQDINLMMEPESIWKATAAVDPKLIGTMNMRLVAKKIKGETTPETYQIASNLIKVEDLKPGSTMNDLKDIIPGWGVSDEFNEAWMKELREANKK